MDGSGGKYPIAGVVINIFYKEYLLTLNISCTKYEHFYFSTMTLNSHIFAIIAFCNFWRKHFLSALLGRARDFSV